MRIAITVDPYIPVPPTEYGGIERTVDFVCRGLTARGHEITLFAHPASQTAGKLIGYGVPPHTGPVPRVCELWQLGSSLYAKRNEFDVVISWGRLAAMLPILAVRSLPKIQRYCRDQVPWRSVSYATRIADGSIHFAGASTSVYNLNGRTPAGEWTTIFDGVEMHKYEFNESLETDAPLAFLGRICPVKGTHVAIAAAKAANRRLIIAGNVEQSLDDPTYFEREVEPHIDGSQISYIGSVDDVRKNALLRSSAALLFPTAFKEAFGIVMAEAMACGTPVLGTPRGSVPEVIEDGVTGFICRNVSEFAEAIPRTARLDRVTIRQRCAERFGSDVIIDGFEDLCSRMLARCRRNISAANT